MMCLKTILKLFVIVPFMLAGTAFAQMSNEPIIRVELKPQMQAIINSPMTGRIIDLTVKDGDNVKKGQALVQFECSEFKAQVGQSEARLNRQTQLLDSTQKLFDLGSASETDLNVLKAERDEAKSSLDLMQALVKKCSVQAPFNGHVASLSAKKHSSLQEGAQMIEVIGGNALDLEMIVPSKWMKWLKVEDTFQVEVEETAQQYVSKVVRYGGKVDPITQSVKLYAQIDEDASELLPGMSGTAYFHLPDTEPSKMITDDTDIAN